MRKFILAIAAGINGAILTPTIAFAQYGIPQGVTALEGMCARNPIRCQRALSGGGYAAQRAWNGRRDMSIPYDYRTYRSPQPFGMRNTTPYMVAPQKRYYPLR